MISQVIWDKEIITWFLVDGVRNIHLRAGSLKMGTDNTTRRPFSMDADWRISLLSLLHNRRKLLHE